jgi:hypothetical protein
VKVHINYLRDHGEPEFRRPAGAPDLTVKGTANYSPASHPLHLIESRGGSLSYERLFSDMAADGTSVAYTYPGTFGVLVPAGKGYRW